MGGAQGIDLKNNAFKMALLRYEELTYKIIGCAMAVHKAQGNACLPKLSAGRGSRK